MSFHQIQAFSLIYSWCTHWSFPHGNCTYVAGKCSGFVCTFLRAGGLDPSKDVKICEVWNVMEIILVCGKSSVTGLIYPSKTFLSKYQPVGICIHTVWCLYSHSIQHGTKQEKYRLIKVQKYRFLSGKIQASQQVVRGSSVLCRHFGKI